MYSWRARVCVQEGAWLDQHHHCIGDNSLEHGGFYSGAFPPLTVWGTAALYQIFGYSEAASRFWSAASGAGCVVALFLIGRQIAGLSGGLFAAFLLASIPYFCRYSRMGQFDAPFIFFALMAVYFALEAHRRGKVRWWVFGGVALGLGLMCKIALALMAMAALGLFALYRVATRDLRLRTLAAEQAIMLSVAALVTAPWDIAMTVRFGREFLWWTFAYHLLGKGGTTQDGNTGGGAMYLAEIVERVPAFFWMMAAVAVAVGAVVMTRSAIDAWRAPVERDDSTDEPTASRFAKWLDLRDPFANSTANSYALPLLWFLFLLAIFSLSGTKRSTYLLPMLPAFCLLAATPVGLSITRRRNSKRPLLGALVCVSIAAITSLEAESFDHALGHAMRGAWGMSLSVFFEGVGKSVLCGVPWAPLLAYWAARKWIKRETIRHTALLVVISGTIISIGYSEGLRKCVKRSEPRDEHGWQAIAPTLDALEYDLLIAVGDFRVYGANRATYYLRGANHGWREGVEYLELTATGDDTAPLITEIREASEGRRAIVVARTTGDKTWDARLREALVQATGLTGAVEGRRLLLVFAKTGDE